MADRSVKVVLTLDAAQYRSALLSAGRDTQTLASRTDRAGVSMKNLFRVASVSTAALGITHLIGGAVSLEAAYSKTMAQIAVATGAPKSELKELDALALKLGRDTVFSAQDAAEAMLALAKGGLSTAQIKAGVLANTLTLASAGGLELGDAANTVVNAMGAFGLKATQTGAAVAALAGAANASSADVSDITQALAQAGTSAHSAGLTIQETTGFLAEFANSGIKGSDAGTSLRTMLTRLVPQTKQASEAMKSLGLSYVDGNGKLVSASQIADRTQKAFQGLSDEERIRATNLIFGNDAQRAVNVITEQGAKGLAKYVKQTSDLTQAQKLAKAANSGTAGSLEQLKGTIETAEIQIGKGLAPTVRDLADGMNQLVQNGDFETWAAHGGRAVSDFLHEIEPLAQSAAELAINTFPAFVTAGGAVVDVLELGAKAITPLVEGFNNLPESAQKALVLAAGAKVLSSRMSGLPGLAGASGRGLLIFGSNAAKAGEEVEGAGTKAKTAGSRFAGLGSTIGANAALVGGTLIIGNISDALNTMARDAHAADGATQDIAATFDRQGQSTRATAASIKKSLSDSNVGKYADDLHINLDRLATDLAKSGQQGEYVRTVMKRLNDENGGFANGVKNAVSTLGHPFGGFTGQEKALFAVDDLKDVGDAADKAADKVAGFGREFNQTRNDIILAEAGINKYRDQLDLLPTALITQITQKGALESREDVVSLARQYNLTPKQVETIMKAKDFASKDIKAVLKYLATADGTTASPHIKLTGVEAAKAALRALRALITNLPGVSINSSKPANPTIENAHGNILAFANGGENHTAQIGTGIRRMWDEPETGGESYIPLAPSKRARSLDIWAETGRRLGVQGFAAGGGFGVAGSNAEWAQHASRSDLKWAVAAWTKALDKNTQKLSTLKDTMKSFSDQVRDNFRTDGFNQTGDTNGLSGLAALQYTLASDTANANAFAADLKKLKIKGISDGLYNALAASGDLTTAGQLVSQSKSQIDVSDKLFLARQRATASLGTQVGTAAYGKQVEAYTAEIKGMRHDIHEFKTQLKAGVKDGIQSGMSAAASGSQHRSSNTPKGR